MKKTLAIFLVAVLTLSLLLSGCGKNKVEIGNVDYAAFTETLIAEKIGNIDMGRFWTCDGGLYYEDDNTGLRGVMSLEGRYDTGAVYTRCYDSNEFFVVSYSEGAKNYDDLTGLNTWGVIDGKGKTLVPAGYAYIYCISDRYILAGKATEHVFTKDDAAFEAYASSFTFETGGSVPYAGEWYIYDTKTSQIVPGAYGTGDFVASAYGDVLYYGATDGEKFYVNSKGEALPKNATVFGDGTYSVTEKVGSVYSSDGQLLFNYDLTGFVPSSVEGGYYKASKYSDGTTTYVIMNNKGEAVSAEFSGNISVYGELVHCNDKIYNFKGETVIDGTYESVYHEKMYGNCWLLKDADDVYTMIQADGSIVFKDQYIDDVTVYSDSFVASKDVGDDYMYYSHKENDYTIKGWNFAPWIIKTSGDNYMYDLVCTITGETLFEGYNDYSYTTTDGTAYYVYAKYEGGADVYLIVNAEQLAALTQKKVDFLNDLTAAFKNEGINVTVDTQSGEIAMDSSVLFGGDSAELTADGKVFLNKFIKAYVNVSTSEKYEGFISKTMVEGHIAPTADSTYASGLALSEQRAANVKNYCLSAETGVDTSKIADTLVEMGYSNSQPIYSDNGEVDMAASRRVSFRILMAIEF